MPASRRLASIRAHHTHETHDQARRGISRHTHGLDRCLPEQRELRSQLALRMLHCNRGLDRLLDAEMVVSARYDRMVWLCEDLGYVLRQLLCADLYWQVGHPRARVIELVDQRTGGMLELHGDSRLRYRGRDLEALHGFADQLADPGQRHPRPHPTPTSATSDAQTLHAALLARLGMSPGPVLLHDGAPWCLSWGHDPALAEPAGGRMLRVLDGAGDDWTLAWDDAPSPATVLRALTHPVLGVAGLDVCGGLVDDLDGAVRAVLRLGSARLQLFWYEAGAPDAVETAACLGQIPWDQDLGTPQARAWLRALDRNRAHHR